MCKESVTQIEALCIVRIRHSIDAIAYVVTYVVVSHIQYDVEVMTLKYPCLMSKTRLIIFRLWMRLGRYKQSTKTTQPTEIASRKRLWLDAVGNRTRAPSTQGNTLCSVLAGPVN